MAFAAATGSPDMAAAVMDVTATTDASSTPATVASGGFSASRRRLYETTPPTTNAPTTAPTAKTIPADAGSASSVFFDLTVRSAAAVGANVAVGAGLGGGVSYVKSTLT